ncbi:cadherin-like beta sandwich domain-containing protein [Haliangium sp.]|uniref:cadherin-like beta sandwich domain-containing protein n=1 Tax=Haliangium sp. TaxID=2663208 RepID=UPI003D0A494E
MAPRLVALVPALLLSGVGVSQEGCSVDALPTQSYVVHGQAWGVLAPLSLRLEFSGGTEILTVQGDGAFQFGTPLYLNDSYVVTGADEIPCALRGASGVVKDDGAQTLDVVCEGVYLEELALSGATAPTLVFDPGQREYHAEVSLIQHEVSVTATPLHPASTVSVNEEVVTPGAPSTSIPLALKDNPIELAVTGPGGGRYVYELVVRRGLKVAQVGYGKASAPDDGDQFGLTLAFSGDLLAIGAPGEDSNAKGSNGDATNDEATDSGAVYVLRRDATGWKQEAYLKASNADGGDRFGTSVALSGDTLAVGAQQEDSNATGVGGDEGNPSDKSGEDSGAVYVFRRDATGWTQEAYIKASNTGVRDHFGLNLALSGDTLVVGAYGEDSTATGVDGDQAAEGSESSGAVYVFRRDQAGWAQEAYLKASNTGSWDEFGWSVAVSGDVLAVGALSEDSEGDELSNDVENSGAVYVFRRGEAGWAQEAYLKASTPGVNDVFGASVTVAGDVLAVGAAREDGPTENTGVVHVFRYGESGWASEGRLMASDTKGEQFGWQVALAHDVLAVGARYEDDAGAVYVFHRDQAGWQLQDRLTASSTGTGGEFGAVALGDGALAVGAQNEDESGAFYVFQ